MDNICSDAPKTFAELLTLFETSILCPSDLGSADVDAAKENLKQLLCSLCDQQGRQWKSFTKLIDSTNTLDRDRARTIILLIVRALSLSDFIPDKNKEPQIELAIVSAALKFLPDFAKKFGLNERNQTYENFGIIRSIHNQIIKEFDVWCHLPKTIEGLISNQNHIYRLMGVAHVKAYLATYGIIAITNSLNEIFSLIGQIADEDNENFLSSLEDLNEVIETQNRYVDDNINFFTKNYYKLLLSAVEAAVKTTKEQSSEKFECEILPRNTGNFLAEKKYPLHEAEREIIIRIPMINTGPGIAKDVSVQYYDPEDPGISLGCILSVGNIRKGPFDLSLNALIVERVIQAEFQFVISWSTQGNSARRENIFVCSLQAQSPDINWDSLRYEEPYSTEIAEGSEFVGRANKVDALVKRVLKAKMQSSYISGQKRIGKTSLAIAVRDHLKSDHADKGIATHYIEWGEVASSDPVKSVMALGDNIAHFLLQYLPQAYRPPELNFEGTISPLNELANQLLRIAPERKFLIVLDEFDEIHPEMYRFGKLAEAFFANLRTLSSKKNIAFMLVGGENMPFIINAQGDQLNRFVYESLDYFSKEREEEDYKLLVEKPTESYLNWSADSIRELFYLTNGHPFYTKLICSEVFSSAVKERDSEINVREINSAVTKLIEQLDTNSFSHHWKDGIQKTEDEAESIALNRCRCLVSIGRCIRDRIELSYENICQQNRSTHLSAGEIKAILSDFVRRQIIRESATQKYEFVVPFFAKWLANKGIAILITDTLGDDIAEAKQREEEAIRVRPAEIESLVGHWQPYRGQDITTEKVRFWLEQTKSIPEQRLLFKLLSNVRFVTETEIRSKLRLAHELVKAQLPLQVQTQKRQYRKDIVISYIDGEAKSGQYFASRYAEENVIPSGNVISSKRFSQDIQKLEVSQDVTVNCVVLIDDLAATGKSISENLEEFLTENHKFIVDRSLAIEIVVLVSTSEGERTISRAIERNLDIAIHFRACEILAPKHYAFSDTTKIWESQLEFDQAKAFCNKVGSYIQNKQPLGYGGHGLLIVFPDRCPNNTLPILHGSASGPIDWKPLFPRPKN